MCSGSTAMAVVVADPRVPAHVRLALWLGRQAPTSARLARYETMVRNDLHVVVDIEHRGGAILVLVVCALDIEVCDAVFGGHAAP